MFLNTEVCSNRKKHIQKYCAVTKCLRALFQVLRCLSTCYECMQVVRVAINQSRSKAVLFVAWPRPVFIYKNSSKQLFAFYDVRHTKRLKVNWLIAYSFKHRRTNLLVIVSNHFLKKQYISLLLPKRMFMVGDRCFIFKAFDRGNIIIKYHIDFRRSIPKNTFHYTVL